MRTALSLLIVAGCACSALALDGKLVAPAAPATPAVPAVPPAPPVMAFAALPPAPAAAPAPAAPPAPSKRIPAADKPMLKRTVLEDSLTSQLVDALLIEDVRLGDGEETATSNCIAITLYSITDKDGNVIEKHDARDPYIWVPDEYPAMAASLEGMKLGGKRKITVPASLNHPNPKFAPTRPSNVPVTIEVELLNLRNVPAAASKADEGC